MVAVVIPALLAGGVSTTVDNVNLNKVNQKNEQLTDVLSEVTEIPTKSQVNAESRETRTEERQGHASRLEMMGAAHAATPGDADGESHKIVAQALEQRYVIVLGSAPDPASAREKAETIRKTNASLQTEIMRNGDEYLVIQSGRPMTRTDALLKAVRIKQGGLNPQLLELK